MSVKLAPASSSQRVSSVVKRLALVLFVHVEFDVVVDAQDRDGGFRGEPKGEEGDRDQVRGRGGGGGEGEEVIM